MHSVLVLVQKPDFSVPKEQPQHIRWADFMVGSRAASQNYAQDVEQLAEGCLLVSLGRGADALARVLHEVSSSGFPYRVLFFEEEPLWVRSGSVPSK